jgi:NAD-dependent DNA ligase
MFFSRHVEFFAHVLYAYPEVVGKSYQPRYQHIHWNNSTSHFDKWSKEEFINNLKSISGWEEKTSSLFVNNYKEFIKFYNSIKPYIKIKKQENKDIKINKYTDQIIVMSGFRDLILQQKLEDSGAKITNSVSKNTNYLIVKDKKTIEENTGKVQKANELGIKIIIKDKVFE